MIFIERGKIVVDKAVFCLSIASSVPEIFAIDVCNCCPKSSALLITHEPLHLAWWKFAEHVHWPPHEPYWLSRS